MFIRACEATDLGMHLLQFVQHVLGEGAITSDIVRECRGGFGILGELECIWLINEIILSELCTFDQGEDDGLLLSDESFAEDVQGERGVWWWVGNAVEIHAGHLFVDMRWRGLRSAVGHRIGTGARAELGILGAHGFDYGG